MCNDNVEYSASVSVTSKMQVLILYSICKKSGIGPSLVNHIHTSTLTNTLQLSCCSYRQSSWRRLELGERE